MGNAFQVEWLDGGIGKITFDLPDKKVNTLSRGVLQELAALVAQLEQRADLRGVLLKSGKPGQFIAGADLNELALVSYATKEQLAGMMGVGHQIFSRISRLPFPTVALIDGGCLGGGTELVLAMDDRIVSAAPHTQISLPEVQIGLLPGWGGTQRLPRLIGLNQGDRDDLLRRARLGREGRRRGPGVRRGPGRRARRAKGVRRIEYLHQTGEWKERRNQLQQGSGLNPDEIHFAFAVAEGAIKGKTKGQYPAPLVALKAIRDGCNLTAGRRAEGRAKGGPRAVWLTDRGQPDRDLLHEEPAGP